MPHFELRVRFFVFCLSFIAMCLFFNTILDYANQHVRISGDSLFWASIGFFGYQICHIVNVWINIVDAKS